MTTPNPKRILVAVDGLSSCGKSTFARAIAAELGYLYIDSGAMYRAVTLALLRAGVHDPASLSVNEMEEFLQQHPVGFTAPTAMQQPQVTLDGTPLGDEIRHPNVAAMVSQVAAIPVVRTQLVATQQALGAQGGVTMDGRDIGQVVFPQAEVKIFMTARPEVRAQRRYDEMVSKGLPADYQQILDNLNERDYIDQHRECNPMHPAPDAIILDNSSMTPAEQLEFIRPYLRQALSQG